LVYVLTRGGWKLQAELGLTGLQVVAIALAKLPVGTVALVDEKYFDFGPDGGELPVVAEFTRTGDRWSVTGTPGCNGEYYAIDSVALDSNFAVIGTIETASIQLNKVCVYRP
jgi:hypothetical protein